MDSDSSFKKMFKLFFIFAISKNMASFFSMKIPLRRNLLGLCPDLSQDSCGEHAAQYEIKVFFKKILLTFTILRPPFS